MEPLSPQNSLNLRRRPFLAGMTVAVVAVGSVSLPAPSAAATPLEKAAVEVRAAQLAKLRWYGFANEGPPGGDQLVMNLFEACLRVRRYAAITGLSGEEFRAVLHTAHELAKSDYLKEIGRAS